MGYEDKRAPALSPQATYEVSRPLMLVTGTAISAVILASICMNAVDGSIPVRAAHKKGSHESRIHHFRHDKIDPTVGIDPGRLLQRLPLPVALEQVAPDQSLVPTL